MNKFVLANAEVLEEDSFSFYPNYFSEFVDLVRELEDLSFIQNEIKMFGKMILEPRQIIFQGDSDISYKYSGKILNAKDWTPFVLKLNKKIDSDFSFPTNSCLINRYRDGEDYMGWHKDNEKELGDSPYVASYSLGSSRDFLFKNENASYKIELPNNSLFLMKPNFQSNFKHMLPKRKRVKNERYNLSYRKVNT
ncbi:MAG: alpha-ketoglutarate-dependent dioxygenase AlkB [Bdellovibrionales bacterium]